MQHAFGWTNSHMHQFHAKDGTRYAAPLPRIGLWTDEAEETVDERKVQLADVFRRKGQKLAYEYDFGDSWIHAIAFEGKVKPEAVEYPDGMVEPKSRKPRAAICLAGERNGPPEDCGGIYGYQHILELKRAPSEAKKDEDDLELLGWLGDWDPERVSLSDINDDVARVRVKKAFQ